MKSKELRKEEFIKKSISKFGNKFDYSKVEYINNYTSVKIICSQHGVFEQTPWIHISSKFGCQQCANIYKNKTSAQYYIDKANEKHNFKYDYSLITATTITDRVKIPIKCENGHIFMQHFKDHISTGNGCKYCSKPCCDTQSFIKLSSDAHYNKYDYSKTEYVRQKTKVIVVCPTHGDFLVMPTNHYFLKRGCPNCKTSNGENKVKFLLEQQGIKFIQEKTFDDCKHNGMLRFDFYLSEYNACIEYDGIQHYKPVEQFGGKEYFEDIQVKDGIKNEFCKSNNIPLLRISYKDMKAENKIYIFLCNL